MVGVVKNYGVPAPWISCVLPGLMECHHVPELQHQWRRRQRFLYQGEAEDGVEVGVQGDEELGVAEAGDLDVDEFFLESMHIGASRVALR